MPQPPSNMHTCTRLQADLIEAHAEAKARSRQLQEAISREISACDAAMGADQAHVSC